MKGKYIVVSLAILALAMATFGWWVRMQQSRRVLELWGDDGTVLLRKAPVVQLYFYEVAPPEGDGKQEWDAVEVEGESYHAYGPIDLVGQPGFMHARHTLLEDVSYHWDGQAASQLNWKFGLKFVDGDESIQLYFDPEQKVVGGRGNALPMTEVIERITSYMDRYRPQAAEK